MIFLEKQRTLNLPVLPVFGEVRVACLLLLFFTYYFCYFMFFFLCVYFPCLVLSLDYIVLISARILVPSVLSYLPTPPPTLKAIIMNPIINATRIRKRGNFRRLRHTNRKVKFTINLYKIESAQFTACKS